VKDYLALLSAAALLASGWPSRAATDGQRAAATWRAQHRIIDLRQQIDYTEEHLRRAAAVMDAAGVGITVDLSGGTVTSANGQPSDFARNKALADRLFPGRFLEYMNLDYSGWDEPDFPRLAAGQIDEGVRLGAAGVEAFERPGLHPRAELGQRIHIDDPKLDPVWERCGKLGMPVSMHVADPGAFWRVIARHPGTTFAWIHFATNAEDLDRVDQMLDRYPNLNADLAARIPELGRHAPDQVRRLFLKHQNRILFATDLQVYDQRSLGSGGSGPPLTDAEATQLYAKEWRWLETNDRNIPAMTPSPGDWTFRGIGLPPGVLRKIYFDNAQQLLAKSMPAPILRASRIHADFKPNGKLSDSAWRKAVPVQIDLESEDASARPELETEVKALWSDQFLYLGYAAPFSKLTVFDPPDLIHERFGLWECDVVEAFIGADPANSRHYSEYEAAPTGEKLDLILNLPAKDFDWSSHFECAVRVDQAKRVWRTEMRIPLEALSAVRPEAGTRWRINLYRGDLEHHASLAWRPTLTKTFHQPDRFGWLEFEP
jgi:hypothetical protein